ncbi:MAG TPA: diguanylate cyclase [Solirubrobacteraceae bacterium]|nr:diguanylate cyclase [Solirubrobacteraceae bacterium]
MGKECRPVAASPAQTICVALAAAVAAIAIAASYAIPAHSGLCWDTAWTAAASAAVGGMLMARRASTGRERRRHTLWAAAAGFWLFGQLLWDLYGVMGFPASPNLADVGWWGFAVVVTVSLISGDGRARSARAVGTVETLTTMAAAVALTVAELWPDVTASTLSAAPKVSAIIYPSIYIVAAVVTLQAIIGGALRGYRRSVAGLVMGGMAAEGVAFGLWSPQLLAGTYVPGRTLIDPLFVLGLLMISAGGALFARRVETAREAAEPTRSAGIVPGLMFVLLMAALVRANLSHAAAEVTLILRAGLFFSALAFVARGVLLESRLRHLLDRERTARVALAEREAELARLNAQLVEDSRRDPLTGMRNRRALSDDLLELDARRGVEGAFAVALCDVDHFKAYNDRLGHLAGDHALRTISAIVRATLRAGDLSYRFGGEELLLILRDAGAEEARAVAERVRAAVQAAAIPHPDGAGGIVTISAGVAAGADDTDRLLARADGALYDAKRGGRNRTVVAADAAPESAGLRQHNPADGPVPRHLRSMLAVSRAAAAGDGPLPVLEALAETIRSELSFHVVAVNLLDPETGEMRIVTVLGDDDARAALMGTSSPWSEWEPVMSPEYARQGAIWLPAGLSDWSDQIAHWTPSISAVPGPNGWHPDDMLLLPLRGQDGTILGTVSVDQPASGRRPTDEQIAYLMSVADHAAIGVEQNLREAGDTAGQAGQSSELRLAAAMLLAEALDMRDPSTGRHSRTVGDYARHTAEALGLAPDRVERIHAAGVLHDLGKLGIADAILYKPGALTDAEWEEMKRHPEIGARILFHAGLADIAHWVRAHHERVDGHGYPDGLGAEEIPLEARILAVADAYEAMIADRPYRSGMAPAAARAELERCAGGQFDPAVVRAFLGLDAAAVEDPGLAVDGGCGGGGEMDDRVGHLVGLQ